MDGREKVLRIYETVSGKRPFEDWIQHFSDTTTIRRIQARLASVSAGNLGDTKSVGHGVHE